MIIGINGKIGAGKDTVGEIIQKLCLTNTNQNYEIKKFAGKLKQIASLLTGIAVEKFEDQEFKKTLLGDEWGTVKENVLNAIPVFEDVKFNHMMSVRELLQKLGTEAMRDGLHENVWVNALFSDVSSENNIIITDMRFPNEMNAITNKGGITIRVTRPGIATETHPSEIALDDAEFDYEIINDGTIEDLTKKVRKVLLKEKLI